MLIISSLSYSIIQHFSVGQNSLGGIRSYQEDRNSSSTFSQSQYAGTSTSISRISSNIQVSRLLYSTIPPVLFLPIFVMNIDKIKCILMFQNIFSLRKYINQKQKCTLK